MMNYSRIRRIGKPTITWLSLCLFVLLIVGGCRSEPESATDPRQSILDVSVVVEGLINPVGLAATGDGSLFIAEEGTGEDDFSAGVSLMTPDGQVGRFISGFHSDRDKGDIWGVPLVALSPDDSTLYVGDFGTGHLWSISLDPGGSAGLPSQPYQPEDLEEVMGSLNHIKPASPFDLSFDAEGALMITSGDGVIRIDSEGIPQFIHQFSSLTDGGNEEGTITLAATGITRTEREFYMTLAGGCPYSFGSGALLAFGEIGSPRTIVDNLNMPIDVAQGVDGTLWVLESGTFTPEAPCFTGEGYRRNTGRLSRVQADGKLDPVITSLNFPGALLPMPDGTLYVSEVVNGRILKVSFGSQLAGEQAEINPPELDKQTPNYREIPNMDAALASVIHRLSLKPNPGRELREPNTPLARLGQSLFFDPILSGDQNISCATCHHPALAMADGRVLPIGTGGHGLGPERDFLEEIKLGLEAESSWRRSGDPDPIKGTTTVNNPFVDSFVPRNSPTVLNAGLLPAQFWDGRVANYALGEQVLTLERGVNEFGLTDSLAAQALFPVTSLHEMAGATLGELEPERIRDILLARLESNPIYREQFTALFGEGAITAVDVAAAIAAFERRFIYTDAPWDQYLRGELDALSDTQKRGALLFFGELNPAVNCAQCHSGDLFTDLLYHNLLVPQLGPGKGHGEEGKEDFGRSFVSFDRRDQYKFRTPSLRNVSITAPYFHNGAYATIESVIWHHANIWEGGVNYDPSLHLPAELIGSVRPFQIAKQAHSVAPQLRAGLPLGEQDVSDLVAFLESLTDPKATDLTAFIPESVPSGLPLDPIPNS